LSSDPDNPDLNGHSRTVEISAYKGANQLLRHGAVQVSADHRSFAHSDGTPFFWLGETLYTTLSDRISWQGFRELISNRKMKGFTAAEFTAGLACANEELVPNDEGSRNEGGASWDNNFKRINPRFFDYADRRIDYVISAGMVPVIFGAWNQTLKPMGKDKMEKHWRYLIARYGAYPVIWVVGGEIYDPPADVLRTSNPSFPTTTGWTQIARYIRATDPYHHLLSAHESIAPYDVPLNDPSLTDFDLIQPGHYGWSSVAAEVAVLNTRWSRTDIRKPVVVGEIGWEGIGAEHLQDSQRMAFWLALLNGAAGFNYGSTETSEAYSVDKPFHRVMLSFFTWREGMNFPGSGEVGIGAKLLKQFDWWRIEPHPEWVQPHGTTLLEPRAGRRDLGDWLSAFTRPDTIPVHELNFPTGEWAAQGGDIFKPYAAGIPGQLRLIYIPYFGLKNINTSPPTVQNLETGTTYRAYYWQPALGIKVDLGTVAIPNPGKLVWKDEFDKASLTDWSKELGTAALAGGALSLEGSSSVVLQKVSEKDAVATVEFGTKTDAAIMMRYKDPDNYVKGEYSPDDKAIYLRLRKDGRDGEPIGRVAVQPSAGRLQMTMEVRGTMASMTVSDGHGTWTTPIVDFGASGPGRVGLLHSDPDATQSFSHFELRESPRLPNNEHLQRKLYDAYGHYRGELKSPSPDPGDRLPKRGDYSSTKNILLNGYRPEYSPAPGDWLLVMTAAGQVRN
jgi:hypothetical protein